MFKAAFCISCFYNLIHRSLVYINITCTMIGCSLVLPTPTVCVPFPQVVMVQCIGHIFIVVPVPIWCCIFASAGESCVFWTKNFNTRCVCLFRKMWKYVEKKQMFWNVRKLGFFWGILSFVEKCLDLYLYRGRHLNDHAISVRVW